LVGPVPAAGSCRVIKKSRTAETRIVPQSLDQYGTTVNMGKPLLSNKRSYSLAAREKMMLFFTGLPEKERPSRTKAILFPLKVCYDRTLLY